MEVFFLRNLEHFPRLIEVGRQGLLDEEMLPCFRGLNRLRTMQPRWRIEHNDIDSRVGDELFQITVCLRLETLYRELLASRVSVDDRDNACVGQRRVLLGADLTEGPIADDANPYRLVHLLLLSRVDSHTQEENRPIAIIQHLRENERIFHAYCYLIVG